MLDNRVEINLMHVNMAKKLQIPITKLNYRQMSSANKLKSQFIGIAENILVSISSLEYWVLFFVISGEVNNPYILEQLFKVQSLLKFKHLVDRLAEVIIYSVD